MQVDDIVVRRRDEETDNDFAARVSDATPETDFILVVEDDIDALRCLFRFTKNKSSPFIYRLAECTPTEENARRATRDDTLDASKIYRALIAEGQPFVELFARSLSTFPLDVWRPSFDLRARQRLFVYGAVLCMMRTDFENSRRPKCFVNEAKERIDDERAPREPGGFYLDPATGLHEGDLRAYDFFSFYPSCIEQFNIGPDTVREASIDPDSEVRLSMMHLGDAASGVCACCGTKTWSNVSEIVGETKIESKPLRVWENHDANMYVLRRAQRLSIVGVVLGELRRMRESDDIGRRDKLAAAACKLLSNSVFGMMNNRGNGRNFLYNPAAYRAVIHIGRAHLFVALLAFRAVGFAPIYGVTDSVFVSRGDVTKKMQTKNIEGFVGDRLKERLRRDLLSPEGEYVVSIRCVARFTRLVVYNKTSYVGIFADDDISTTDERVFANRDRVRTVGFRRKGVSKAEQRIDFAIFCARHLRRDEGVLTAVAKYLNRFRHHHENEDFKTYFDVECTDRCNHFWEVINDEMRARVAVAHFGGEANWIRSSSAVWKMIHAFFSYHARD